MSCIKKHLKKKNLLTIGPKELSFFLLAFFLLFEYVVTLKYFDISQLKLRLNFSEFLSFKLLLFSFYVISLYIASTRPSEALPEIALLTLSPITLESFYNLNLASPMLIIFALTLFSNPNSKKKYVTLAALLFAALIFAKFGLIAFNWSFWQTLSVLGLLILAKLKALEARKYLLLLLLPLESILSLTELWSIAVYNLGPALLDKELLTYRSLIYGTSYVYCGDSNVYLLFSEFCTKNLSYARYAIVPVHSNLSDPTFKILLRGKYYNLYEKILLNVSYRVCSFKY